MRKRAAIGFMILGAALLIILPAISVGQFQFGKGKGGGGQPGGGMQMDPNKIFDLVARGKDHIVISDMRQGRDAAMQYAKERGITNGQLTRQQYVEYFETKVKAAAAGATPGGKTFGGQPITTGGNPGGGTQGESPFGGKKFGGGGGPPGGVSRTEAMADPNVLNKWIEDEFKRRDNNGDGKLNADEMQDKLRANLARWDRNNDTFITLEEYREYFMARLQGTDDSGSKGGIASIIIEENELDLKPTILRAGKLPKNMPGWFKELDTDVDGQVALFEWRAGKKNLDEFRSWDINDDGFVTPEECLRQQETIAKSGASPGGVASVGNGDRPSFNGFGKRGNGGPPPSDSDSGKGKKGFGKGFGKGN